MTTFRKYRDNIMTFCFHFENNYMCKSRRNMVYLSEKSLPKPILYTLIDIIIRLVGSEGDIYPNT